MLKPLYPYPALLLDADKRYVIISDLHIGFEEHYRKRGIAIDDNYIYDMLKELKYINKDIKPDAFIILGDIKDSIAKISKSEWKLIPQFLEELQRISDVIIIPGNHDNNIDRLVPNGVTITSIQGLMIEDTLLMHGHTIPRYISKRIVMGHLHPRIIKDGSILNGERVWIFIKIDKSILNGNGILDVVVLPSFNKYLSSNKHNSIVPLLRKIDDKILDCLIIRLDGSIIGNKDMLKNLI